MEVEGMEDKISIIHRRRSSWSIVLKSSKGSLWKEAFR